MAHGAGSGQSRCRPAAQGPWAPRPRGAGAGPALSGWLVGGGAGHGARPRGGLTATAPHLGVRGAAEGRLTSSRAEMVEAGVPGALAREGLWAGPGRPGESPSPATSWISRARVATSFTSVWLSLQRQEGRQVLRGPPGPGLSAGKCGDRSQTGHDVTPATGRNPPPPRPGGVGVPPRRQPLGQEQGQGYTASSLAQTTPSQPPAAVPGGLPLGASVPKPLKMGGLGRGPGRRDGQIHPQAPGHQGHMSPAPQAGRWRQSH